MITPIRPRLLHSVVLTVMGLPATSFAASCICFTCAVNPSLENFRAASESMAPTLNTGDCAVMRHIDPLEEPVSHGQIIGLVKEPGGPIFVFRVMALAGDSIAMTSGRVVLNGAPLVQDFIAHDDIPLPEGFPRPHCEGTPAPGEMCRRLRFSETLPGGTTYEVYDLGKSPVDDTPPLTVPDGHVFVMGDHRDNANDSRAPLSVGGMGPVPIGNIKGVFEGL